MAEIDKEDVYSRYEAAVEDVMEMMQEKLKSSAARVKVGIVYAVPKHESSLF